MDVSLTQFIKVYGFSTGRRIVAVRKIRKVALGMGAHPIIITHTGEALEHDHNTRRLDLMWIGHRDGQLIFSELRPIDDLVDTSLTGVRDGAVSLTKGARPGDIIAAKANQFLAAIFPAGVGAVTTLQCVDQLAAVEVIAEKLQGELAPMVRELGLTLQVNRLLDLVPEYRQAIENRPASMDFNIVRQAREQGQTYLVELVALILGTYYKSNDPDHIAARAALLAPIIEQQEAIRVYRQARRPLVDLDPDTELPEFFPAAATEANTDIEAAADTDVEADANTVTATESNPAIPTT
jgi:hypothetical protein